IPTPPTAPPATPSSPPTAKGQHKGRNFALFLGVVGLVVLAFYLGQGHDQSTQTANGAVLSASAAPTASTAPTASVAPTATAVPATVAPAACVAPCGNANGYTLTINSANRNAPTDEFSKPEPGTHLVIVTMTFKNGSNDTQSPDSFCCRLTDSLGATRSETISLAPGCESWQGVQLARGGSLGPRNMCFAAAGDPNAPLTLVWSPSFGA